MPAVLRDHAFRVGPPFAVGVEEDLLLVDAIDLRPAHAAPASLEGLRPAVGRVMPEVCDAMVELVTPVCASAAEAADVLGLLRDQLERHGVVALGVGVHPDGRFGDVRPGPGERFHATCAQLRGLIGRTPCCGMHVHVALPDPETAIRAYNGMRKWVPLLQALSANSPFWHGQDSGLASARVALVRSLPRTRVSRAFHDYADYLACVDAVLDAGGLDDYTSIWWDVRPHPRLGTLEVRAADAQASLRDAAALVALTQCLVVHEAADGGGGGGAVAPEALDESSFRAFRDGIGATLWFDGEMRPVTEIVALALRRTAAAARELGCRDELRELRRILHEGNGACRQRAAFADAGMTGVLARLRAETQGVEHAGIGMDAAAA